MRSGPIDLTIRSVRYAIDIDAMTQTNVDSSTARTIRRRVHREAAADTATTGPSDGSSGPIAQGDRVRVKAGVTPSMGWGSVCAGDVGVVVDLNATGSVVIDFPAQSGWGGIASEIELVASASDVDGESDYFSDEEGGAAAAGCSGFRSSAWEAFCASPLSAAGAQRERAAFMRSFSFDRSSPLDREASGSAADAGGTGVSATAIAAAASLGIMPPAMPMPPSSVAPVLFKKVTS